MNLQAKRSVFRSRLSQKRTRGIQADLATSFLAHRLAVKNRRQEAKEARREARLLARPQRRGGARITSSASESLTLASAMLLSLLGRKRASRSSPSAGESVK